MKSTLITTISVMIMAVGCSSLPPESDQGVSEHTFKESGLSSESDAPPTDSEVMYRVFAGEITGAEGDLQTAANEYLEAAIASQDPAIAERATRVAVAAKAWQHAAMAAVRWVELAPDRVDALEMAARVLLLQGDYVGAEYQMGRIIELMGHDQARAWALVTSLLSNARHVEKADRILQHLVEDHSAGDNADALFARSQMAARGGDFTLALELAEAAVQKAPERAELLAWAGRIAVNVGEQQRAIDLYRSAWSNEPENTAIALAFAELLRRDGQFEVALDTLKSLPDTPQIRFARVVFARESGMPELAEEIFAGFADADYSDKQEQAFQAGQGAEVLGKVEDALAWYARVESGERALGAVLRRAVIMAGQGRVEDARNLLSQVRIRRDPEIMVESFLAEGRILVEAGLPGQAYELFGEGLAMLEGESRLLYGRAMVAVELERLDDAERDLRQIIAAEPDNVAALNGLGYTLADRTDRLQEAEALIDAAFSLQPEDASIIDSKGWVAYRMGRGEEALSYLREAWARSQNAEIAAHLGEVLWSLDRRDEALEAWRVGLERDPDNPVLQETLKRFEVEPGE